MCIFKSAFLSILPRVFLWSKMEQIPCWGKAQEYACTHVHAPQFEYRGKHTLLTTNNFTIRHTKGKSICGYVLKEKISTWLPKSGKHSISFQKQSSHGCKARSKRRRKKSHVRGSKVCLFLFKCQCPPITKSLPQLIKVNVTESYRQHFIH